MATLMNAVSPSGQAEQVYAFDRATTRNISNRPDYNDFTTTSNVTDTGHNIPSLLKERPQLVHGKPDAGLYVSPEMMVENQLTNILGQDNAFMRQAEARGRAKSQAQGTLSSQEGIKAVESARIAAAMPMAQQNAATWKTFYENEQTADYAKDMATHQFGFQKQLDNMKIDSAEKQTYMNMMGALNSTFMNSITNIMSDPNITNSATAMDNALTSWKNQAKTFADIIGFELDFNDWNWSS